MAAFLVSYSPLLQPVRIRRSCGLIVYYMVPEAGVEPAPPHRLAWRGALPQHILSYSDIRKGVRPALRCRVRANAFKLGGRENLSDGASGDNQTNDNTGDRYTDKDAQNRVTGHSREHSALPYR